MITLLWTLLLFGLAMLASVPLLSAAHLDIEQLQRSFTSDGKFDPVTLHALGALPAGLLAAGAAMVLLAALLFLLRRTGWLEQSRTGIYVAAVLGAQVLLAALYLASFHFETFDDFSWYHNQARNILAGRSVITNEGAPTAHWPAGFPFFLSAVYAVTGAHLAVARVLNIVLITAITLLTWLLARRLWDAPRARTAALLIAVLPSQIFWCSLPTADMFFTLLCLALLYVASGPLTWKHALLAGLLYGCATFTRPVLFFFPPVLALYWLLRRESWKRVVLQVAVIFVVGCAVLAPWQVRNYRVFGQFVLVSTNGGIHLWMGNNPKASGGYITDFIPPEDQVAMSTLNEAQQDSWAGERGKAYLKAHPGHALSLWPKKLVHLFYRDSKSVTYSFRQTFSEVRPGLLAAFILFSEGVYYALGAAFLVGLVASLRRDGLSARVWLGLGTVLYFTSIHLPFITEGRYHMPLLPLFAIFAAFPARAPAPPD